MNLKRLMIAVAAVAAVAAASVVCVVAAAFGLYAAVRGSMTPAGSAAVVAAAFAVIALLIALTLGRKASPRSAAHGSPADDSLTARVMQLAREKPLMAAGVGVAAAAVLLRNPQFVMTLISAAMAGRAAGKSDR